MLTAAFWMSLIAPPPLPDPCTLVAKADVQAFIGEITKTAKEEPEQDDDSGGMIATCSFMGKTKMLFVSVVEFKSVAEATKKITAQFIKDKQEGSTIEPEPGVGDRAFFGHSDNAAMIVTQKGARAYAVGVGGRPDPESAKTRASLHKLLAGVAAKG